MKVANTQLPVMSVCVCFRVCVCDCPSSYVIVSRREREEHIQLVSVIRGRNL